MVIFVQEIPRHNQPAMLRSCCVISKSWVPRSRMYLFTQVIFSARRFLFESWMKTFPDPSNSPAHYTQTLTIQDSQLVTAAGADAGRWICAFRNIVCLHISVYDSPGDDQVPLVPFHGLSPTIRSLHLEFTYVQPSEVFGLMCSFPHLEDFTLFVFRYGNDVDGWTTPSTSPRLTESLELRCVFGWIGSIPRQLLDLPNSLHFTKMVLPCSDETVFHADDGFGVEVFQHPRISQCYQLPPRCVRFGPYT